MKIILFSDTHGNLEALEAFLETASSIEYERIYNLGDTVGYGADPNRCVEIIREKDIPSVTGNHEDVVLGRSDASHFNPDARRAILWCQNTLTEENKNYLKTMNDFIWMDSALGKALLVHGSPLDKDDYVLNKLHAEEAFESMTFKDITISFIGHTHQPCFWLQEPDGSAVHVRYTEAHDKEMKLNPSLKAIVNVGSIGQPRDGDPRGSFVIWDDVRHTIKFLRFEYPVKIAQDKIRNAGLPPILAERLATGF